MVLDKFREKIRKNLEEKKKVNAQIKAANKVIEQRATAAALREKEKQSIRYAEEKQKILAERKLNKLKENRSSFWSGFEGVNSYGTSSGRKKVIGTERNIVYKKGKKGKKKKIVSSRPKTSSYSFGGLVNSQGRYDVLGY